MSASHSEQAQVPARGRFENSSQIEWYAHEKVCVLSGFLRHFYAALLENGAPVAPTIDFHADEMLPWVHLSDGLPFKDHSQ